MWSSFINLFTSNNNINIAGYSFGREAFDNFVQSLDFPAYCIPCWLNAGRVDNLSGVVKTVLDIATAKSVIDVTACWLKGEDLSTAVAKAVALGALSTFCEYQWRSNCQIADRNIIEFNN